MAEIIWLLAIIIWSFATYYFVRKRELELA